MMKEIPTLGSLSFCDKNIPYPLIADRGCALTELLLSKDKVEVPISDELVILGQQAVSRERITEM